MATQLTPALDSILWTHCRWFNSHEPQPSAEDFTPVVRSTKKPGTSCLVCGEALTAGNPELLKWRHRSATEPHPAVLMAATFVAHHGAQRLPAGLCATCGDYLWADPYGKTAVATPPAEPPASPRPLLQRLTSFWRR